MFGVLLIRYVRLLCNNMICWLNCGSCVWICVSCVLVLCMLRLFVRLCVVCLCVRLSSLCCVCCRLLVSVCWVCVLCSCR